LAGLQNALKVVGKSMQEVSIVISGAGAAGVAIAKMLMGAGASKIVAVDRLGAINADRDNLTPAKQWLADHTNPQAKSGPLSGIMDGADVFLGVSGPGLLSVDDVKVMAKDPIIFAMANPTPEIMPEEVEGLVAVMATGRSDYPNQINNVLAFPGIFRGALDARASDVTESMKLAAAEAIAQSVSDQELSADFVIPSVFDKSVPQRVAIAVHDAAIADGVARGH